MSDKLKKLARELAAKRNISYQAALNLLIRKRSSDPRNSMISAEEVTASNGAGDPLNPSPDVEELKRLLSSRPHEPDCPLYGGQGSGDASLQCECLGIDYSLPLLDGDDHYD